MKLLNFIWDKCYETDLRNFVDSGQFGEVWFGKKTENRIVDYIVGSKISLEARIVDIGCGNGSLLRSLRSRGYRNLKGIDCCESAVKLAVAIAEKLKKDNEPDIPFETVDVLTDAISSELASQFDLAVDKGTWDAISLSDEKESRLELYRKFIGGCLKSTDSLFIVCSCNYTIEELKGQFSPAFSFVEAVPSPVQISFGGHSGSPTSIAVFKLTLDM